MSSIGAVMFDFDHTLGIDNKLEEFVLRELGRSYGATTPSEEQVVAVLGRFRSGELPLDEALAEGLRSWGCLERNIGHAVRAFRERALSLAPDKVRPLPGARTMLHELAARDVPLGILSNGWTQLQHLKAWLINFPGPVLASEEIGVSKPDARAFATALARFEMDAPTTVYVGDDPRVDIAGARLAGMLAGWVNFEEKQYPSDMAQPDLIVRNWNDFAAALES